MDISLAIAELRRLNSIQWWKLPKKERTIHASKIVETTHLVKELQAKGNTK